MTTSDKALWQPGFVEEVYGPQGGVRRLFVGFYERAVAGQERGYGVGDSQGQRIIPRHDKTDNAQRVVVFPGFCQEWEGALAAAGFEVFLGGVGVVAGGDGGVEDFFKGVFAGLAVFLLDQVEHFPLTVQH